MNPESAPAEPVHLTPNQKAWRRFWRNRMAAISVFLLGLIVAAVVFWPALRSPAWRAHLPEAMTRAPNQLSASQYSPPSAQHWFGTDLHGRDLLSRAFYGARISLLVGAVGAAVSLVIGVLWGSIAGYLG